MADYPTLVPDAQYQADQQSQFQKYASQLGSPVDKYLQDQQNKFQAVASGLTAKLNDTMQNVQTKAQQAAQSAQPAAGDIAGWRNVIASQLPEQYRDNADLINTILAGGYAESGLNPTRMQQGGNGVGFWQFDTGGGMGTGVPLDQLKDEAYQASRIIPQYIQAWENAPAGLSPAEKASWVAAQAERPYDYTNPASTARRNYANAYDVVTGSATSGGSPYQGAASVAADEGANRSAGPSAGASDQSPLAQFQAFAASLGDPVDNALAKAKAQLQQDSQGAVQTAQNAASDVGNTVDQARQTANNLLGQGVVDTLHLGSPQSTAGQAIPQTPLSTQPTEYAPDGTTPDQNLPPAGSGPTVGSVLSTVGRIAALPAELGRAGFPDVTAPSSLSPGQRIADAWQATAGQPLGERVLQTGEQASAPFQHDLAANAQQSPMGGVVSGVTNTAASLGTDPTITYGGGIGRLAQIGTGVGGVGGLGYSLATGANPQQTAQNIEQGANLGMAAGGIAELGHALARGPIEALSKPSAYEIQMQTGGAAPTSEEAAAASGGQAPTYVQARDENGNVLPGQWQRYYHGTGQTFVSPDATKFDPNGLFGPGYYMTDSSDVAGSYAQGAGSRTVVSGPQSAAILNSLADRVDKLGIAGSRGIAQRIRQAATTGPALTLPVLRQFVEYSDQPSYRALLNDVRDGLLKSGGNVRAINVPNDLNLLNADQVVPEADYQKIATALTDRFGNGEGNNFLANMRIQGAVGRLDGEALWNTLRDYVRDPELGVSLDDAPIVANQVLAHAGFDGVQYAGGQRVPLLDSAGNPVTHNAVAVFPESLPKVRNALSGLRMGGVGVGATGLIPKQPWETEDEYQRRVMFSRIGMGVALAGSLASHGAGGDLEDLSNAQHAWESLGKIADSLGEDLGFHNEVLKEELADIPNATGTAEGTPEYNAAVAKVYQDYSRSVAQDLRSTVGQKLAEVTTQRDALQETIDPQMQDLARKLIDPNTQNLRQVPLTQWRKMGFSDPKANALVKENGVVYVRPEYALDTVAQEAGFDGTNAFEAALNKTRAQMGQLNDLKNQAKSLAQTNDKLDQIFQGTIPETAPKSGNISLPERAQRFLEQAKGTPEQQAALRPTEAGDAANILLKKFPSEVQPYIQDAANQFGQFAGQRRGVISDAQALENAKAIAKNGLGMSVEDFLKTKPGKAFNQEEAIALGQTMTKYGKDLDTLTQQVKVARANGTVTPELEAQVADKALEFAALSGVRSGAAAEAGRALRSFRQELSGEFSVRARAFGKAAKSFGVNPADLAKQEKPTTPPSVGGTAGTMSGPTRTLTDAERQALFEDLRSGGQAPMMGNFPQLTDLERAELFRDLQSGGQPRLLGGESKPLTDEERALLFQDLRSGGQSKLFGKFAQLSEADRQSLFPGVERTPDQPTLPGTSQATERTPLTDDERAALMADLHSGGQAPMMGNVDQLTDEERARLFPGVERTPDQPSLPGANPEVARTPEQEAALVGARADMAALNDAEQAQAPISAAANPMGTTREQQINAAFKAIGTNADQFKQWITAWETTPADDLVGRYKLLQALYKPSLIDKALALATANMLSSPKTLMVVASHGAVQTLNRPLIEALRGSPSEAMTDLTAMGHAIGQAWANAGQALLEGVGPTQAAARLREGTLDVRPEAFPGKQGLLFTPSLRAINAAHEFYRTLSTAGALAVAARREAAATGRSMEDLLKEPTPSMLEYATKAAEDAVSGGEASPFAKILLKGRSLVHQEGTANKATGLAFYALTPFVRIPDYLFRNGAKILAGPVAYPISAGVKLAKGDAAGAAGDMKVWGLVSALDTAIYTEAAAGNITGGGPTDPHKLRALQEANGPDGQPLWQAHSIRIGGRWYDYTTMGGPLSVPLSAIASAVEEYRAEQGQGKPIGLDFAGKVADHTAQALMDTSYIKTVGDIFKSIAEGRPTAAFSRVGADVAERMVPYGGALALGARTIDQNAKAPEPSGLPVVGDIPERVEARIPFLSRNVPNQVGVFGEQLRQPQDVLSTASPALTSAAGQYNPASAEVARLNQAGYAIPLRVFSATEQEKGGNYLGQQQTGAQMRALQGTYGQAAQAYITEVMNRPDYAKMSDAQKAATIKEALKGADSIGALQGAQSATLDPAHQAIVAWESTPHYLGVKGTPEQVRIQNYAIAQAKLKLSAYEKQYGQDLGAARLLRDDRKAYILSERPMLDATYLRLKKAEIDKQYSVTPGSKNAGALGAGHTVPSSITNQATTSQPALPPMPVVQRGSVPVGSGR